MIDMPVHCTVLTTVRNGTYFPCRKNKNKSKNKSENNNDNVDNDEDKDDNEDKNDDENNGNSNDDNNDKTTTNNNNNDEDTLNLNTTKKTTDEIIINKETKIKKSNTKFYPYNKACRTINKIINKNSNSIKIIELKGFTEEDVRDLLNSYIGIENITLNLINVVKEVSSGSVYWVKAIANFLLENGMESVKNENNLENSLQFLMFCRLDLFSSIEQLVAKTASIVGYEFSLSVLSAILKSGNILPGNVFSALESLQSHGFIFCKEKIICKEKIGEKGGDNDFIFSFQNCKIHSMLYDVTPKR